jgi:hypothetical protein
VATTNPLSRRSRAKTFTGAEVAAFVDRQTTKLAASKKARVVRKRDDYDLPRLQSLIRSPTIPAAAYSWTLTQIVAARDQQMAGRFRQAARLAESMGTDDAIFTARGVRLAPVQSLSVEITPGSGPKAEAIAAEAEALFGDKGIAITSETMTTIRQHLVDHGVAFGAITTTARADGSRLDVTMNAFPIEFVDWDAALGCYVAQVRDIDEDPEPTRENVNRHVMGTFAREPIVHGNGRWVVFAKSEQTPHRFDATLLPAALVWARHAFAMRDWTKGSASHGNAKIVGELPEGTALSDEDGADTQETTAFMTLLGALASQDSPYGVKPFGSKIEVLTNGSGAWEVFAKLVEFAERAAARIYLGTDGVLGAQGGAPGVDISELFGVATSKVQSDLRCIERAVQSGVISYWCAINFGDDKQAPGRTYRFPDPDEARVREDFAKRNAAYLAAMNAAKALTPEYVATLAAKYDVPAMPIPAPVTETPAP